MYVRNTELDVQNETNTRKIVARLMREGCVNAGGGNHDKFRKLGHGPVIVPRHAAAARDKIKESA